MSDTLSFADGQYAELLPPRTVLSLFSASGDAGTPGDGGQGDPGNGHNGNNFSTGGQVNVEDQGIDGRDGSANPGG
ncbi:MAG: hypothetical protein ACRDRR_22470 [Pseudonocardiaceae bacterium]